MNGTKNIIKKELTRVFTDRKMIFSLFLLPGILIMVMYTLIGNMIKSFESNINEHIPLVYIQNAPENLGQYLEAANFEAHLTYLKSSEKLDDIKDGILKGDVDLLVVFDENFLASIRSYAKSGDAIPEVKTYYNTAEDYSVAARSKFVEKVLNSYQQALLAERLGNIEQLQVFYIDKDPSSSVIVNEEKASGKGFSMLLPYLMIIMMFQGAMSLGIDAITGEKERGTMSSMLLSPIKRSEIVLGKLVSLAILTTISAVIYTVSVMVGLKNMGGGSMGDINKLNFSPLEILQLFSILVVLVYLFVALVSLVAVYARTAKEAGTYVMPLMILVMLGSIITMFSGNMDKELKYYAIPVYNSAISIQKLLIGELTMPQFGLTVGSLALFAILVTTMITKAFNSEKVMFNA